MGKILIYQKDEVLRQFINQTIMDMGHQVSTVTNYKHCIKNLKSKVFDVVFIDNEPLSDLEISYLLEDIEETGEYINPESIAENILSIIFKMPFPDQPIPIIIAKEDNEDEMESLIKKNAYDVILIPGMITNENKLVVHRQKLTKNLNDNIIDALESIEYRKINIEKIKRLEQRGIKIIGKSRALISCLEKVVLASKHDQNVLILGETGTGKQLIAKAIHDNGKRSEQPFIEMNCAAIPENLVESEFFGFEKGSHSTAYITQIGVMEAANTGTLFLDEIGDLSLSAQAKLLKAIEEQNFCRIGSSNQIKTDFRLICATNQNLKKMVEKKQFRADLLFRIQSFVIKAPSLKERTEDIPELSEYYINFFTKKYGLKGKKASPDFMEDLMQHDWPGNIRDLMNVIEESVILGR